MKRSTLFCSAKSVENPHSWRRARGR